MPPPSPASHPVPSWQFIKEISKRLSQPGHLRSDPSRHSFKLLSFFFVNPSTMLAVTAGLAVLTALGIAAQDQDGQDQYQQSSDDGDNYYTSSSSYSYTPSSSYYYSSSYYSSSAKQTYSPSSSSAWSSSYTPQYTYTSAYYSSSSDTDDQNTPTTTASAATPSSTSTDPWNATGSDSFYWHNRCTLSLSCLTRLHY